MNNKGFAITTVVYAIVLLLSLVMFTAIVILKNEYVDQKTLITEIRKELTTCLKSGDC